MLPNENSPSEQQVNQWFQTIKRVLSIVNDRPFPDNMAYAPAPLRADLQECVDLELIAASREEGHGSTARYLLTVTAKGQDVYDVILAHLISTGQVHPRDAVENRPEGSNPFDDMNPL